MLPERKKNIRSMRFSDRMIEIIEAQAGENFTQKFEALVTRCMWEVPEREKELQRLDAQVKERREELRKLSTQAQRLSWKLNNVSGAIDSLCLDMDLKM